MKCSYRSKFECFLLVIAILASVCLCASIIFMSAPLFYMATLAMIFVFSFKSISLIKVFLSVWAILFVNFFFGVLSYKVVGEKLDAVIYIIIWISSFVLGYLFIKSFLVVRFRRDLSKRNLVFLRNMGFIGALFWVVGGVIYSYEFLLRLDFYSLRLYYVYGHGYVPMLSSIGSILSGACFFILARLTYIGNFEGQKLSSIALILLLLVPLFMAGRQLYLQIILYIIIGSIFAAVGVRKTAISAPFLGKHNVAVITFIVFSMVLLIAMSIMRFSGADAALYQTKLSLFTHISSVELNSLFSDFYYSLPIALRDLFVEFSYYFGSQLGSFIEIFNMANTPIIGFDLLSKSAFVVNNLNKVLLIIGMDPYSSSAAAVEEGYISSSAWGTVIGSNIGLFGYIGALMIQFIFGGICAVSQIAFDKNRDSFIAHNFVVANAVVIFYGIMDSIYNEVYFLFYYVISFVIFIASAKFFYKIPNVPNKPSPADTLLNK